jgi:hypothetical protein
VLRGRVDRIGTSGEVGRGEQRGQPDTVPLRLGLGQRQTVKTLCRPLPPTIGSIIPYRVPMQ